MPYLHRIALTIFLFLLLSEVHAQITSEKEQTDFEKEQQKELDSFSEDADTNYIYPYHYQITGRVYLAKKWTGIDLFNVPGADRLHYRPNSSYNVGVGVTYKGITVNLAYGFGFLGFLNPSKELGVTTYLDLQTHMYGRKWLVDVMAQVYKGFYASPQGTGSTDGSYYLRSDLNVNEFGASVQYVFNNRRFSYRAAFLQNEWQKKSAGTFLLGAEAYYGTVNGDSSIIPIHVHEATADRNIKQFRHYKFGPSIGYAYTLVIKKHFFATGSLSANAAVGNSTTVSRADGEENNFGFIPSAFYRISLGYNSERWAASAIYTSNNISANPGSAIRSVLNASNIRLNLVYRFAAPKGIKKTVNKVKPDK